MYILNKKEDEIYLLYSPEEKISIGSSLTIGNLVCQVIDVEYANVPGIVEHILRTSIMGKSQLEEQIQEQVSNYLNTITDQRLAITKIRGSFKNGKFTTGFTEFDINRSSAPITILTSQKILEMLNLKTPHSVPFANTITLDSVDIDLALDKLGINLITGMKGSGKSYAAKKVLLKLIEKGKIVLVFDINGEYLNLWKDEKGNPGDFFEHIVVLDPQTQRATGSVQPLRIPLHEISYDEFAGFLNINPESQMYNAIIRFWSDNAGRPFDLNDLENWVSSQNQQEIHEATQLGLLSKIKTARSMNLFGNFDMKSLIENLEGKGGGSVVISLKFLNRHRREVVLEFMLRHIVKLRQENKIKPIALFAEEAQLYVTQEIWDDLLTRMRHHGIHPTFITNDPTTLPGEVFSLCDNMIAFTFHNDDDINQIAKAKVIDTGTLEMIKHLQKKQCIIVGDVTSNYPILAEIKPEEGIMMGGETQTLF